MIRRLAMAGLAGFALLPAFTPAPALCRWGRLHRMPVE